MEEKEEIKNNTTPPPAADLSLLDIPYHDPKVYEAIITTLRGDVLPFDDTEQAFWFRRFWLYHVSKHAGCKDLHPEQYREYMHDAVLAGFVAFNRLTEGDQVEHIRDHLLASFEIPGYSLRRKIEIRLLLFPFMTDRDALREKLRDALLANVQPIVVADQLNTTKRLTVGSMARNYLASLPPPEAGDALTRQRFLNYNNQILALPQEMKEKCRVILELFDWLSLSSFSDEGFEEHFTVVQDGKRMVLRNGRVEDAIDDDTRKTVDDMIHAGAQIGLWSEEEMYRKPPILQPDEFDRVLGEEYDDTSLPPQERGRVLERDLEKSRRAAENLKRLEEEYQRWLKSSPVAQYCHPVSSDAAAFDVLYDGINKRDAALIIPAFLSIASSGRLHSEFNSQDRYHVYWGKRVQEERKDMFQAFEVSPGGVLFVAPFIRHILVERLKIGERDALMVGVMLSNLARNAGEEEYATMAYGDMNEGVFKWNDEVVMFG